MAAELHSLAVGTLQEHSRDRTASPKIRSGLSGFGMPFSLCRLGGLELGDTQRGGLAWKRTGRPGAHQSTPPQLE